MQKWNTWLTIFLMNNLDANDLMLFARVAETGSFSRAAEQLRLPKSTVSRRVASLEESLGERLLQRTSRKLAITDFGTRVLGHARAVTAEVEGALALAQHRQAEPSGRLRVSLLGDLAALVLPEMLAAFARRYPEIRLELDLSPRRVDVIGENFDLALQLGEHLEDSGLSARKLVDLNVGLFAAPSYLREAGTPAAPDDLLNLHWLMSGRLGETREWSLGRDLAGTHERWHAQARHYTLANSPAILLRMAHAGFGVISVPDLFTRDSVQRGALIRVLPEWSLPAGRVWAVFPERQLMPARTRAFLDALVTTMGTADAPGHENPPR